MTARTPAEAITAVRRVPPLSDEQRAAALALLTDLLTAAERHAVTLADFGHITDLPGACVDLVVAKTRHP